MKAIKWILGMIPVVLIVAALGGVVYLGLYPEKGEELRALAEEKLGDKMIECIEAKRAALGI